MAQDLHSFFSEYFPFWDTLSENQKNSICASAAAYSVSEGTIVHNGSKRCTGLLLVEKGRFRCFCTAENGREATLYRLFPYDICLFSASCILHSLTFQITVEAEQDTRYVLVPANVFEKIAAESASVSKFVNELMASRFSEVMWLMDQMLNSRMNARVAGFLMEERRLSGSDVVEMTHERIARHLGTAREVVSRTLKYLADNGAVRLCRGGIIIEDPAALERFAGSSIP